MMLTHLKPPKTVIHEPCKSADDQRLKHIILPWEDKCDAQLALVGVPFDEAITAGGGRAGASEGPDAIRQALKHYGTTYCIEHEIDLGNLKIVDCGDLEVVLGDTEEMHSRLTQVISALLQQGMLPITLGGGHDLSFATIRALTEQSESPVGGINVDAHLDLRPVIDEVVTSGTPFRRALEELSDRFSGECFVEIGMLGQSNAKVHCDYLKDQGGILIPLAQLQAEGAEASMKVALQQAGGSAFFSIDIDAVQQAFAPGCSAPAPVGLTPDEVTSLAYWAGASPTVKLFDLMEVCPRFDSDGRTARLAASILSYFFTGFAKRLEGSS